HSPTAMQRPLSCGPRPMHGPLTGQRRLAAGQVLPPSVVCSTRNAGGWLVSVVGCDQKSAWTPAVDARNPPNRPIPDFAGIVTGWMTGRPAHAGAAVTLNGIEAIGGGNDEPSLLCGGWPSIAIWRNPPPFRPVNGAHPLTASSVPGGPLPGLASRTAQFASV